MPTLAWWPGTVTAGSVSSHPGYFGDVMATACDLAGIPVPDDLDSISFLPSLRGDPEGQDDHPYLCWEFYEQGGRRRLPGRRRENSVGSAALILSMTLNLPPG